MSAPNAIKELIGHRSTLCMYRDCLKVAPMMQPGNTLAQENIKKHFRISFESQRVVSEDEHKVFRSGIIRTLSNFLAYEVQTQYLENPEKFNKTSNIYDADTSDEEGIQEQRKQRLIQRENQYDEEDEAAEVDIDKLPFM